jgi:hypothetical protein
MLNYRNLEDYAFSPLERRRFSRFIIPLEVRYQTQCPDSGKLQQGQGILRDISLCGGFFHLDHPVSLQPGQVLDLTIAAPLPLLDSKQTSHFSVKGEVVRLEPAGPANPKHGVAVNFLQKLSFAGKKPF